MEQDNSSELDDEHLIDSSSNWILINSKGRSSADIQLEALEKWILRFVLQILLKLLSGPFQRFLFGISKLTVYLRMRQLLPC